MMSARDYYEAGCEDEDVGAFFEFTTPGQVEAEMDTVNTAFQTLNQSITNDRGIRVTFRDAWDPFYREWNAYYADNRGFFANFFGAPSKLDKAREYRTRVADWRSAYEKERGSAMPGPGIPKAEGDGVSWKWWALGALGVVALAWGIGRALPGAVGQAVTGTVHGT